MHPPVKQPNLTRKFPLSDLPTGLLAALVTPLADHLLIRRVPGFGSEPTALVCLRRRGSRPWLTDSLTLPVALHNAVA
jgi:hypothetical protein